MALKMSELYLAATSRKDTNDNEEHEQTTLNG